MQTTLRRIEPSGMLCSVSLIPPLELLERWPEVSPLVKRVLERSGRCYRVPDVFDFIHRGLWQLWMAENANGVQAIAITSLENYPLRRSCLVRYMVGDMGAILSGMATVEAWAKAQGCSVIEGYGRKGWERKLGWKLRHVVLEKELR